MILFHGSDTDIISIDLTKCRPYKDFGKGFYLTTIKDHAEQMALKVAARNSREPVVCCFDFDLDAAIGNGIIIKEFYDENEEWAKFVYSNREIPSFKHNYDIVIGGIADDGLREQFFSIKSGLIGFKELAENIKFELDNIQYCFCTEKSLKYLRKI